MNNKTVLSFIIGCLFSIPLSAQLSVVLRMDPAPSPYLSDWRSKPNTVMLIVMNPTNRTYEARVDAYVEGDRRGKVAETKLTATIPAISIPPGSSNWSAVSAHLLEEGAVTFRGPTANEALRSGRLPEDNYRLCVRLVEHSRPETALSSEMCSRFEIKLLEAPDLIAPQNNATVSGPPSFQWSAVSMGIGTFATYELTLVRLEPGQSNLVDAVESGLPLLKREVALPVYQYLPSDPSLEPGKKYAWRVRAFDPENRYTFANNGKSGVWLFTYMQSTKVAVKQKETPVLVVPGKLKVTPDPPISQIINGVFYNCTLTGRYLYTFERSKLLAEKRIDRMNLPFPANTAEYKPLKNVNLRLVRIYKTNPEVTGAQGRITDQTTGRLYNIEPKTVAYTTTDENGDFTFHFISADSTVIVRDHSLDPMTEMGSVIKSTLYKGYVVEVVNPRYCTSGSEIGVNPGETVNVTLTSLVRTYNLDVRVFDSETTDGLGLFCNAYISRYSKNLIPGTAPEDEGELPVPVVTAGAGGGAMHAAGGQLVDPDAPSRKFTHSALGYVISCKSTAIQDQNKGHVLFTRLVRNYGGLDNYYISARTPEYLPNSTVFNDLYYFNSDRTTVVRHSEDPNVDASEYLYGSEYSAEVVYNLKFSLPTFSASIAMTPRMPRIIGRVKRSDSDSDLVSAAVCLDRMSNGVLLSRVKTVYTDIKGMYEIADMEPTPGGKDWEYRVLYTKFGYKNREWTNITIRKGYQMTHGTTELDPITTIARKVVNEHANGLAGVKGVLGMGVEHTTTNAGLYLSKAAGGWQLFHLEKRSEDYADKDTTIYIKNREDPDIEVSDPSKWIVMFKAHRRLTVKVVGPGPDYTPIEGAEVILEDKYTGGGGSSGGSGSGGTGGLPQQMQMQMQGGAAQQQGAAAVLQQGVAAMHIWKRSTGADGRVHFVYDSPDSVAHISVSVPGQPFVPRNITVTGIPEDGRWKIQPVFLNAGGIVKGVVYAGEIRLGRDKDIREYLKFRDSLSIGHKPDDPRGSMLEYSILNPPVSGARVTVEGYPSLTVFTNAQGEYELIGVPTGSRTIKAGRQAAAPDSQYIGDEYTLTVRPLHTHQVSFFLKQYLGMDITKLYGFPIEIDKLTELPSGNIRIDGAFSDIPSNSIFRLKDVSERLSFVDIELTPMQGAPDPPPAVTPSGAPVPLLNTTVKLIAFNKYHIDLTDSPSPTVRPRMSDQTKGYMHGLSRMAISCFNLNSNEFSLTDSGGAPVNLHLARIGAAEADPLELRFGPLTSEGGALDTRGAPLRIALMNGSDATAILFAYNASFPAKQSFLENDGMHLRATIHAMIQSCGSSAQQSCDVPLDIGEFIVGLDGMPDPDPSQIQPQDIKLQKWTLRAENFSFNGDYFRFDGSIQAPLVSNLDTEETRLIVPFTAMELRPDKLMGGDFQFSEIDMLGIAKMKFTKPFTMGVDGTSWFMTSEDPYVPAEMGQGKFLEGLAAGSKILLDNFYLRSNGATDISPAQAEVTAWDVSTFQPNSFQFGYVNEPFITMQGSLTLINIPDIAPQFTRFVYTQGGKFNMDAVYLQSPFNAGGVKMTIAHGILGPEGFVAEGEWGQYRNRIFLQGQFSLNMWFRHKKVGPNQFSTIAEIINPDHNRPLSPPQNQSMFGNPSGPDVWSAYGRTQLEADMNWSTNLVGWYKTDELAGRDSMYYYVAGTGGNGTVNTGNGTMKMKGTTGGLGMMYIEDREAYPKGPAPPGPPEDDDSPFSDLTITMDFEKMAIIAEVSINAEISGGVSFEGHITTVVSFGARKFWSFFAAGKGVVENPPCNGSAVFLAGLNYEVSDEEKGLIVDYSISGRELPPEFNVITGFFTQIAVTLPIPGTPNFSIDLGFAGLSIECSMGGEARVGLNFAQSTTFFIGLYFTAKVQVDAYVIISAWVLGFEANAQVLVKVWLGAWFMYNDDAGASFEFEGGILGQLNFGGCLIVMGEEAGCGEFTLFTVGGIVRGGVGSKEYLDIEPTFTFLGIGE